jgi:hypothetical protein
VDHDFHDLTNPSSSAGIQLQDKKLESGSFFTVTIMPYLPVLRAELAMSGIGCHHAGMSLADRRSTEEAYKKKLIKVVVATSV